MGKVQQTLSSYHYGLLFLAITSTLSALLISMLPFRRAGALDDQE